MLLYDLYLSITHIKFRNPFRFKFNTSKKVYITSDTVNDNSDINNPLIVYISYGKNDKRLIHYFEQL